jgi:hypothetical protein
MAGRCSLRSSQVTSTFLEGVVVEDSRFTHLVERLHKSGFEGVEELASNHSARVSGTYRLCLDGRISVDGQSDDRNVDTDVLVLVSVELELEPPDDLPEQPTKMINEVARKRARTTPPSNCTASAPP